MGNLMRRIRHVDEKPEPIGKTAAPHDSVQIPAKRSRSPNGHAKRLQSLRLDQDVIDGFKAGGAGWQSRVNAALRQYLGLDVHETPPP